MGFISAKRLALNRPCVSGVNAHVTMTKSDAGNKSSNVVCCAPISLPDETHKNALQWTTFISQLIIAVSFKEFIKNCIAEQQFQCFVKNLMFSLFISFN